MDTDIVTRAAVVLGLLAVLFGLGVWYGSLSPVPDLGAYPEQADLAADYPAYVGAHATVDGRVTATDPVTIAARYGGGESLELRIVGLPTPVETGDHLRVYGVVEPDRTIRAENAFTVLRTGWLYMVTVSFLAGLWVLGRILVHWRIDRTAWALAPEGRHRTRRLRGRLAALLGRGE
jgi:hypothetical protein